MKAKPIQRLGPYDLLSPLGAGGMGEVFRARDTRLNRDVAVKVLPKDFVADADRLRRFEQEAKTLAALNHPNVLTVHDAGVQEGAPYLVSELLEGNTLRQEMNDGALPVRKATEYGVQIAQGLAAAQAKGVVHRDLKPENIFVTKDARVKILDFGLAKLRNPSAGPRPLSAPGGEDGRRGEAATIRIGAGAFVNTTEPGMLLGTPAYMSPEQVRGEPADHRADIFAFGCVLYEMLSGTRAFRRNTPIESMNAVLNDAPPELSTTHPNLPLALVRIVERCLEKQPDNRFQSAKDLAFAIEAARDKGHPGPDGRQSDAGMVSRQRQMVFGIGVLLLIAVVVGWWFVHQFGQMPQSGASSPGATNSPASATTSTADLKSIAVLPFANMSAAKENEYFSDGITEEILNALARTPGLRVAARTSAFSFKGKNESVQRIGEALKVGVVLEGSVRREGKKLRITAQLISVADGFHLWSDTFDRQAEDVFAIQSEVAQKVTEVLMVKLLAGTDNLEAYDLYLRGRHFWNLRTGDDVQRAVGLFQQATEKDPKFAAAYAGLAASYVLLPEYAAVPMREAIPKARAAARRALELDGRLAEAHAVLGSCAWHDWDLVGAEQEYQRALSLNPNHATSHHWYSMLLGFRFGKTDEALAEIRKARALDPLSPVIQCTIAVLLCHAGRDDEALVEADKALQLAPDFPLALVSRGMVFLAQKKIPEAIVEFEKVREKTGDTPFALGNLGHAYARAGRTNEARQILEKLKSLSASGSSASWEIGLVYGGLGDLDQAWVWYERLVESRDEDPRAWKYSPLYADLVKDPRYAALLKKFGLDK